uniref:Predicted protein n=1 Tax=Hordeum vulgare subsp. vulgare TaxID=112509 RepID=F2E0N9_HORVV|nr:predicted protein [Hordeum vulgare subsp. vulgare]
MGAAAIQARAADEAGVGEETTWLRDRGGGEGPEEEEAAVGVGGPLPWVGWVGVELGSVRICLGYHAPRLI